MIRFPDRHEPQFAKLCERLANFSDAMGKTRRMAYEALAKKFNLEEEASRRYRRAHLRRRRPVKRSVW